MAAKFRYVLYLELSAKLALVVLIVLVRLITGLACFLVGVVAALYSSSAVLYGGSEPVVERIGVALGTGLAAFAAGVGCWALWRGPPEDVGKPNSGGDVRRGSDADYHEGIV